MTAMRSSACLLAGFALLVSLVILLAPVTYEHYLVLMLIPFIAVVGGMDFRRGMGVLFVIAFSLISLRYSLDRFVFFQSGWPVLLASGKTAGVLLVWLILFLQLMQRRGSASTIHEPPRQPMSRYLHN